MTSNALELRIPPPAIAGLAAGAMWGIAAQMPVLAVPLVVRAAVAIGLALLGAGTTIAGVRAIRRAQTTANPLKPETATALVSGGIYTVTRNPMYLGLLALLVAWAAYLSSAWALLGPLVFALYITRFQILPEERALAALFGADYAAYQARVRRWL
ncbi:MAG: isoprenylcysteine carboxylmethyltransferase family protein [Gammaproteobacteria bacterium]|nr:isoprenylcysteine carboxylmethyltransferase family protein [Gammaproteobacteria bacterium]